MDLYPPLYVPRPTVEPERFASLRPPTYNGALTNEKIVAGMMGFGGGNIGFGGGIGGGGLGGFGQQGWNGQFGNLGGQLGMQGNNFAAGLNFNRYQNNTANTINPMLQQQLANGQNAPNVTSQSTPTQQLGDNNNANFDGT